MDPVTHLLFGHASALAVRRRREMRGLTAGLVLGSIVPDIDVGLISRGFDVYLRAHASGTHSLAGSFIEAPLLAIALSFLVRGSRLATLMAASWAGVVGHIVWDLADGSDIALFQPFSSRMFGWHLVSMGEPMVLVVLASAWLLAWRRPSRAAPAAAAALTALVLVLSAKAVSQRWAWTSYRTVARPQPLEIEPVVGSVFRWTVYDRMDDRVRAWRVDARTGAVAPVFERTDLRATELASVSRNLPVVQSFLSLSKIPFARIEARGARRMVLWSDARGCSPTSCDVSFGGLFDAGTAPLDQVIQVGGLVVRRPLAAR